MCESDCGPVSRAASRNSVHPHCRLFRHLWQVCSLNSTLTKVTKAAEGEEKLICVCREKDMDHAVRIPEMGVSKVPAETLFLDSF